MGMTAATRTLAPALVLLAAAAGCAELREADPTGVLGGGDSPVPGQVTDPAEADAPYPNLSSVPLTPPRRPSAQDRRQAIEEDLLADRGEAAYSDEPPRPAGAESAQVAALGPEAPARPPPPPRLTAANPAASAPSAANRPPPESKPEREGAPEAESQLEGENEVPQATQTASLPPPGTPSWPLRLSFAAGAAQPTPAQARRLAALARELRKRPGPRIAIRAYAAPTGEDGSQARRLSLRRALAVRSVLTAEGLAANRIDVRALGASGGQGDLDRVEITPSRE